MGNIQYRTTLASQGDTFPVLIQKLGQKLGITISSGDNVYRVMWKILADTSWTFGTSVSYVNVATKRVNYIPTLPSQGDTLNVLFLKFEMRTGIRIYPQAQQQSVATLWSILSDPVTPPTPPEPEYDTDAKDFFDAVSANGGSISSDTKGYVNTFVEAAKSNAYWDDIKRLNLFCGDDLAACAVPLKADIGATTDTLVNFVALDFDENVGLQMDGTSKYVNTGTNTSTDLPLFNAHMSLYVPDTLKAERCLMGAYIGATQAHVFGCPFQTDYVAYDCYNNTTGHCQSAVLTGKLGHIVATRAHVSTQYMYRDGNTTPIAQAIGPAAGTPPNLDTYVGQYNNNGSPSPTPGSYTMCGYSIGTHLTATDVSNFYTDLQAFQTSLGRST